MRQLSKAEGHPPLATRDNQAANNSPTAVLISGWIFLRSWAKLAVGFLSLDIDFLQQVFLDDKNFQQCGGPRDQGDIVPIMATANCCEGISQYHSNYYK